MLNKKILLFIVCIYNNKNISSKDITINKKKIIGTIFLTSISSYGCFNIYKYHLDNQKKEEKILKEKFIKNFSSVLKLNGLKNDKDSLMHVSDHSSLLFNFKIEDRIKKINLIINKIEEIINEIKNAKYEQKILLNEWIINKNEWDIYKNKQEIKKELFDFFVDKNLFKKFAYKIFEWYLFDLDDDSIKRPYCNLKNPKEEIDTILNKIMEIKHKLENMNIKNEYKGLLKTIINLYEDCNLYKQQIK